MLAFSDGLVLPFLPSDTNFEGRFKILAKSAQHQLKTYQKRFRDPLQMLDSHSPVRMLARNYLTAVERAESKLPEQFRTGINPQGAYPANVLISSATCGVSSVGSVKHWVASGKYRLDDTSKDLVADFRGVRRGVRARDDEFLVGSMGDSEGMIHFGVSYDASAIDEERVKRWKERIETAMD
jgi:hypothetical protein